MNQGRPKRTFERCSIEKEVEDFCGWDFLLKILQACCDDFERALVATLFETGCRASELVLLRRSHFLLDVHPKLIVMDGVPVVKKYEKIGEIIDSKGKKRWITRKREAYRTFPIRRDEPLVKPMLDWVLRIRSGPIFPQLLEVSNPRHRLLYIIRTIGRRMEDMGIERVPFSRIPPSKLHPHWFRDQRVRQLKYDYGFQPLDLAAFFRWEVPQLAVIRIYGMPGWRELALRMGVRV
jgi:integrase